MEKTKTSGKVTFQDPNLPKDIYPTLVKYFKKDGVKKLLLTDREGAQGALLLCCRRSVASLLPCFLYSLAALVAGGAPRLSSI